MKSFFINKSTTIHIDGVGSILLERSHKAKRLNITVRPFKGVRVAVPKGVSFKKAEEITRTKSEWIKKQAVKTKKYETLCQDASSTHIEIDPQKAAEILVSRLNEIANQYGYKYNRVSFRNQKTRWGSCSSRNNISLNIKLTLLPDELCDYIILHELAHTKVKNHQKEFWAELLKCEPNARELDKRMRQYDLRLL